MLAGAVTALGNLQERALKLALASNFDTRLRLIASGLPALAPIEHLIISSEVGWRKPAIPFFDAVCRVVGEPAEKTLFVGDDMLNDFEGARHAGMRAVLFDPTGKRPGIRGLRELYS
jgi:putative hydrolase of the HAD superfamily